MYDNVCVYVCDKYYIMKESHYEKKIYKEKSNKKGDIYNE